MEGAFVNNFYYYMQNRKSSCLYHPDQHITNFCRDKNCLMPLCPSCIGQHTQYHEDHNTKPSYHNIFQTLADVQAMLYNSVYSLEQDRKKNSDLIVKIQSLGDIVKEKILMTKTVVYNIIDKAFIELQADLRNNLNRMHEQMGLYSIRKSQKFDQTLKETLEELYNLSEGLKSDKYLGHLILFLKDRFAQCNTIHSKLVTYLNANDCYQPKLQYHNESLQSLNSLIMRIIKVDPKKEYQRGRSKSNGDRQKLSILKNKNAKLQSESRIERIQKSYTPQKSTAYLKAQDSNRKNQYGLVSNSPYRQKVERKNQDSVRIRDYKQQYEVLSRKVSQLRKQNQQFVWR